ncbi:MAG: hypothetical protein AAF556_05990, partial [Pseudomonadota bacterium]
AANQLPPIDAVTIEAIGLVHGTKSLGGDDLAAAGPAAKALSETIGQVVQGNKYTMDPEIRRFLSDAGEQFGKLADAAPGAAFARGFEAARDRLELQATRIFSHRFAPDVRDQHHGKDDAALAQIAETDPVMKIAVKMRQI